MTEFEARTNPFIREDERASILRQIAAFTLAQSKLPPEVNMPDWKKSAGDERMAAVRALSGDRSS